MSFGPTLPDFDTLVALYEQDPESFEHFRKKLLQEAVDCAPAQHQPALERLLGDIERTRAAAATPMDAAIAASRAMQQSLERLVNGWAQMRRVTAQWQAAVVIERARH